MSYKMKNKLKFVLFYKLYRIFNGLALKCYQIYWESLNEEKKCPK